MSIHVQAAKVAGAKLDNVMAAAADEDLGLPLALAIEAFRLTGEELGPEMVSQVLTVWLMKLEHAAREHGVGPLETE